MKAGSVSALAPAGGGWLCQQWRQSGGAALRTFSGHTRLVYSVAFSPDGRAVLSASSDTTLKLWDVARHTASR